MAHNTLDLSYDQGPWLWVGRKRRSEPLNCADLLPKGPISEEWLLWQEQHPVRSKIRQHLH